MPNNFTKKLLISIDKLVNKLAKQEPSQDSELCFINLART